MKLFNKYFPVAQLIQLLLYGPLQVKHYEEQLTHVPSSTYKLAPHDKQFVFSGPEQV